jgi:hypothetical protein
MSIKLRAEAAQNFALPFNSCACAQGHQLVDGVCVAATVRVPPASQPTEDAASTAEITALNGGPPARTKRSLHKREDRQRTSRRPRGALE